MLKKIVVLVNTLSEWLLAYMSSTSQILIRALPLDPAGGLLSPVPRFCPPPKQISGYVPGGVWSTGQLLAYQQYLWGRQDSI